MASPAPGVRITDLSIAYRELPAVADVSLTLPAGGITGLVGESGSGKSTLALALLGAVRSGGRVIDGRVEVDGVGDILRLTARALRAVRGRHIGYVVQAGHNSLNPVRTIGRQVLDLGRAHRIRDRHALLRRAGDLLARMGLDAERVLGSYQHELSGGMRQRVGIMFALVLDAHLLILDEPTTSLDMITQAEIMRIVRDLHAARRLTTLLVSHDLAAVAELADRLAVMQAGRVVEQGPTAEVLAAPRHPHTRSLLAAVPRLTADVVAARPGGCRPAVPAGAGVAAAVEVRGLVKSFRRGRREVAALRGVDLSIPRGGAVSVIGESGCGKTTLGRILAGLEPFDAGALVVNGVDVADLREPTRRALHRRIQLVHQDPYTALNPTRTVASILRDPLRVRAAQTGRSASWVHVRAAELLTLAGLDPADVMRRYPHQLSGGMRQRVVIARALTVDPEVIVADEAVTMIDAPLRLGILRLLCDLRRTQDVSMLFITHDVAAARYAGAGGELCVLYRGEVVERGPIDAVLAAPAHPYTRCLLSAVPVLPGPAAARPIRLESTGPPDERVEPVGCRFAPRCPVVAPVCLLERPALRPGGGPAHRFACHRPLPRAGAARP